MVIDPDGSIEFSDIPVDALNPTFGKETTNWRDTVDASGTWKADGASFDLAVTDSDGQVTSSVLNVGDKGEGAYLYLWTDVDLGLSFDFRRE